MEKSHEQKQADIKSDIDAWAKGAGMSGEGQRSARNDAMKITPDEIKDWANTRNKTDKQS